VAAYNRGNALYRLDRHEDATRSYDRALASDPGMRDGWYNLGNSLYHQDRWREAVEAYQRALALEPGDVDARHNMGLAQARLRQDPKKDRSRPRERPTPPVPMPTVTPKPDDRGPQDIDGKEPEPKDRPDPGGPPGARPSGGKGPGEDPRSKAKKELGLTDQQVEERLNASQREESRLREHFSRDPRRAIQKRTDFLNMTPQEMEQFRREFLGEEGGGKAVEVEDAKDW
jgi:tetratricopeptide (TPR) repeat protein